MSRCVDRPETSTIRSWMCAYVLCLPSLLASVTSLPVYAAQPSPSAFITPPATRQLCGITPEDATVLLGKLEDAQRHLQHGEFLPFTPRAGSIASYDMTNVPPRAAFLQVPFAKVWDIGKLRGAEARYSLSYALDGTRAAALALPLSTSEVFRRALISSG